MRLHTYRCNVGHPDTRVPLRMLTTVSSAGSLEDVKCANYHCEYEGRIRRIRIIRPTCAPAHGQTLWLECHALL